MTQTLIYFVGFVVVCLASYRIGTFFSAVKLPYITGYLFTGALIASFGLQFIPTEAAEQLRFVDQISLAVIAFVAGSELFLKELLDRIKGISFTIAAIVVTAMIMLGTSIFLLTAYIPFTQGMNGAERLSVALLGATVLLALSPPSAIAVIKELRARGSFTRLVLGVTVMMDVVIIVLFAINSSITEALLTGVGIQISFVFLLLLDLALAVGLGFLSGYVLRGIMALRTRQLFKIALILLFGYAIYALAVFVKTYTKANLPFEIYIEPLLIAMIGGFFITNFTRFREEFADILHDVGPIVYVAFFTLTGISLKLDVLLGTLVIALILFMVRIVALLIGSFVGGTIAREPRQFNRLSWMGFVTQAGIALGLAREAAVAFPQLGDAFATLIIAVIVLNEVFGPLFLRVALQRVGESHVPASGESDGTRNAVILGVEGQSLALARQLISQNWQVRLADTDASHIERLAAEDVEERHIAAIDETAMGALLDRSTNALVAMLNDDEANLRACEIAYEKFGVRRLVVRPVTQQLRDRFNELGAIIIDPASAVINVLEQSVRAPQAISQLLQTDVGYDIVQITITDPSVSNRLVRDLRVPNDVLLLDITRSGQSIVPHGYTRLMLNDEVTVVGKPESLQEVTLKLGY